MTRSPKICRGLKLYSLAKWPIAKVIIECIPVDFLKKLKAIEYNTRVYMMHPSLYQDLSRVYTVRRGYTVLREISRPLAMNSTEFKGMGFHFTCTLITRSIATRIHETIDGVRVGCI